MIEAFRCGRFNHFHITIAYGFKGDLSKVEPYQGEIVLGPEVFAEVDEDWQATIIGDARRRKHHSEGHSEGHSGRHHSNHFDPSQPRGNEGRWIETGKGEALSPLKPVKERAFNGEQVALKHKFATKKEAGDIGEKIAMRHLAMTGRVGVRAANSERSNYPVDIRHDGGLVEVKTGLVSNNPGARVWRATIGQPGKDETQKLLRMVADEKKQWNAVKMDAVMNRKFGALKTFTTETGVKSPSAHTVTVILNPDTRTADVYEFENFHRSIRWNKAEPNFVGTFSYDD